MLFGFDLTAAKLDVWLKSGRHFLKDITEKTLDQVVSRFSCRQAEFLPAARLNQAIAPGR